MKRQLREIRAYGTAGARGPRSHEKAEEPEFIWKFPSVVALGLGVGPWKTLRQSPEGAGGPLGQPEGQWARDTGVPCAPWGSGSQALERLSRGRPCRRAGGVPGALRAPSGFTAKGRSPFAPEEAAMQRGPE